MSLSPRPRSAMSDEPLLPGDNEVLIVGKNFSNSNRSFSSVRQATAVVSAAFASVKSNKTFPLNNVNIIPFGFC